MLLTGKNLRQFHIPNVSLVTTSIMDVCFTNHLRCKISLTRGTLNIKKESLKYSMLFKIILDVNFVLICQFF